MPTSVPSRACASTINAHTPSSSAATDPLYSSYSPSSSSFQHPLGDMSSRHDSYHSSREKGKYDEEEGEEAEAEEEVQGIFVRALFGFRTEEESSLTFEAGDVIEILGQLESGWWDGVFDGNRGWLPSNYVTELTPEETLQELMKQEAEIGSNGSWDGRSYDEGGGGQQHEPFAAQDDRDTNEFWVPRVTGGGQIYYLNTQTGETAQDLPSADDHSETSSDPDDYQPSPSAYPIQSSSSFDYGLSLPSPTSTPGGLLAFNPSPSRPPLNQTYSYSSARSASYQAQERSALVTSGSVSSSAAPSSDRVPHPWLARAGEDGSTTYYYNPDTGEARTSLPTSSSSTANRLTPSGSSSSLYATASAPPLSRTSSYTSAHLTQPSSRYLDRTSSPSPLDPESDPTFAAPRPSNSLPIRSNPREEAKRRQRELEDRYAPAEPEGIPVLALNVRNAIRGLKESIGLKSGQVRETPYEDARDAEDRIEDCLDSVVSATRCLVYASGVLNPSVPSSSSTTSPTNSTRSPPSRHNSAELNASTSSTAFIPSESVHASHRKVQSSLSRLLFSVRSYLHEPTAPIEKRLRTDAEDVERVVVAFGLEAERDRTKQSNNAGAERKARRLEGWLDSMGVAQPVGGRNGFTREVDSDLVTRSFGLEPDDAELKELHASTVRRLDNLTVVLRDDPSNPRLPDFFGLLTKLSAVVNHVRSFDIASSIDLDGADEESSGGSAPDPTYAGLVERASEVLSTYETSLDGLSDTMGLLVASLGILSNQDIIQNLRPLQNHLTDLVSSFLILSEIACTQNQLARSPSNPVRSNRIGFRRPSLPPSLVRLSTSRMSIASNISSASRRSHLLSLRGARNGSLGIDQELDGDQEEEIRDAVDWNLKTSGLPSSSSLGSMAHPGGVGGGGRGRTGSLGAMSTASSEPSTMGGWADGRFSGSSRGGLDTLARDNRRESNDTTFTNLSSPSRSTPTSIATSKAQKLLGTSSLPLAGGQFELPWFLERPDYAPEDLLMVDGEQGKEQVKGGTLEALVAKLTTHIQDYSDHAFRETFLQTYKSFVTSQGLFDLLRARFFLAPPNDLTAEENALWVEKKQKPIRLKVANIIRLLIKDDRIELEDHAIYDQIKLFTNEFPEDMQNGVGKNLRDMVVRVESGQAITRFLPKTSKELKVNAPPPILYKKQSKGRITDFDPQEIARQLTLIESKIYNSIRPVECLANAWSDKANPMRAPHIKSAIQNTNLISKWVVVSVLDERTPKARAAVMKFFIQIADRCLELNNFASVAAIGAGLNSSSISRLYRTFDLLSPKTTSVLETLKESVSSERNFSAYKARLQRLNPPAVPFLGVYLTYLTFIEDGNPNFLSGEKKLINFGKRTKATSVLREMADYQIPYTLHEVAPIQDLIRTSWQECDRKDEAELYERSKELEPREQDNERVTRMLEESGFL